MIDTNEVEELINYKQEGAYWDFKREWYLPEKKQDLLFDIICFANNLVSRDCYIIIGVDEQNYYAIK
ncbi:MAG: ATP-binding protein, partial [Clostridia bacterium]|nr:ATP-binding protein [Clostridia bacterium]